MTAEMERLFANLRNSPVGTQITFQLEPNAPATEAIITAPLPSPPPGMEGGVFLQDAHDPGRLFCLAPDPDDAERLLVHVLSQAGLKQEKRPSPVYADEISERANGDPDTHFGGGANKALCEDVSGSVDTDAGVPLTDTSDAG